MDKLMQALLAPIADTLLIRRVPLQQIPRLTLQNVADDIYCIACKRRISVTNLLYGSRREQFFFLQPIRRIPRFFQSLQNIYFVA